MAGDECVVTKSGKGTHGLDRFFSSLYEKAVPGLAFFVLSLVSTKQRRSYPMRVEQVIRSKSEKAEIQARKKQRQKKGKAGTSKRKPGRPKGSKNKNKTEVSLSEELSRIQVMVKQLLGMVGRFLPLSYLLLDGHFGNNNALQMARQCGLHLISKLRTDSALYFRYDGPYAGQGPHQVYGQKFNPHNIPADFLKSVSIKKGIETRVHSRQFKGSVVTGQ